MASTRPATSTHDYISTLIAWRRDTVLAMCGQIEKVHGRDWVEVVGSARKFSECMIYGRYVDDVLDGAGHFHGSEEFCRVHWTGEALSDDEFRRFVAGMAPEQVGDRHAVLHRHRHRPHPPLAGSTPDSTRRSDRALAGLRSAE